MLRSLGIAAVLVGGCRSQRAACEAKLDGPRSMMVERCVEERWSDRKIDCMLRAGDGLLSLYCED